MLTTSPAGVRRREIAEADLHAVSELLSEGFKVHPPEYWIRGLRRHARRPPPAGYPTYGYCLENDGEIVGAILLLFSQLVFPTGPVTRCNISSWYVKDEFRTHASLLVTSTTKEKNVTYFNITPAPHTWSTVEAQGFNAYCRGQKYGLISFKRKISGASIEPFTDGATGLAPFESDILKQHAGFGCLAVVLKDAGNSYPFVFQKHFVKGIFPVHRLIYCRHIDEFVKYSGNLGRLLLQNGSLLTRFDSNDGTPAILGWYMESPGRKYAKGPNAPGLGDLAYSESALFDS